jgi:hypothetical protein
MAIIIFIFNIAVIVTNLVIIRRNLREHKFLNRVIRFYLDDLKR